MSHAPVCAPSASPARTSSATLLNAAVANLDARPLVRLWLENCAQRLNVEALDAFIESTRVLIANSARVVGVRMPARRLRGEARRQHRLAQQRMLLYVPALRKARVLRQQLLEGCLSPGRYDALALYLLAHVNATPARVLLFKFSREQQMREMRAARRMTPHMAACAQQLIERNDVLFVPLPEPLQAHALSFVGRETERERQADYYARRALFDKLQALPMLTPAERRLLSQRLL